MRRSQRRTGGATPAGGGEGGAPSSTDARGGGGVVLPPAPMRPLMESREPQAGSPSRRSPAARGASSPVAPIPWQTRDRALLPPCPGLRARRSRRAGRAADAPAGRARGAGAPRRRSDPNRPSVLGCAGFRQTSRRSSTTHASRREDRSTAGRSDAARLVRCGLRAPRAADPDRAEARGLPSALARLARVPTQETTQPKSSEIFDLRACGRKMRARGESRPGALSLERKGERGGAERAGGRRRGGEDADGPRAPRREHRPLARVAHRRAGGTASA